MALDEAALRGQLNMTEDEADEIDEAVLTRFLDAAKAHTRAQLGFALDDVEEFPEGTPADVEHGILMLAAHWFEQREATISGTIIATVPLGYDDIIANHRRYSFG